MKLLRRTYYQNKTLRAIFQSTAWLRRPLSSRKIRDQEEVVSNLITLMKDDPILDIAEFQGFFCFDVRSHLFKRLILQKYYEPELAKLCVTYINPTKDVIDVGANIGLFSVLFGKIVDDSRKVLSIEPTKNALSRLLKNIEINGVKEKVSVFNGVASDIGGTISIKTIVGKEEYSSIGNALHPVIDSETYVMEQVKSKTVDELVLEHSVEPGFIKVDVEGCEHMVFGGCQETLKKYRPVIISELSDFLLAKNGSSSKKVIQLIEQHGYDIFDPLDPFAIPNSKEFGDIICFPKEMNITSEKLASVFS
jgi:FkbM family methyltransferase